MRSVAKILLGVTLVITMGSNALAQSPREQLQQMVEQLRGTPSDTSLRERIIKLAQEIQPAPAVPEEARRHFIRGSTIARSAKDAGQQALAVEAFKEALLSAPWWGDAYYNQGIAQELAGQWDAAERSFKLFILANPGGNEARDAQDRIYGLEGKKQLAEVENKKTMAAAQQAAAEAEARRFEGNWYRVDTLGGGRRIRQTLTITRTGSSGWNLAGYGAGLGLQHIRLEGRQLRFNTVHTSMYPPFNPRPGDLEAARELPRHASDRSPSGEGFEAGTVEYYGSLSTDGNRLRFAASIVPPSNRDAKFWKSFWEYHGGPGDQFGNDRDWLRE